MTKTADDAAYDTPYNNIQYTSSTSGGNQIWTASSSILLTGTKANVYAYYPYDANYNDITAIPIDVSENKDVMWASHAENVYNASPTATLPMNHALAVIRFSLSKGDYTGAGAVQSITVQGDCIASSATLNAKNGTISNITGAGSEISFVDLGSSFTLGAAAQTVEQLVVPTTTGGPIKVTIKVDDKTFEATSSVTITADQSKAYKFGLAFSDSKLTMSTVSIGEIAETEVENMTPIIESGSAWSKFTAENDGVYGIDTDGKPLTFDEASSTTSLSGVAIVMYGRAMQISNDHLSNQVWGSCSTDISRIGNLYKVGGGVTGNVGYLQRSDGTYASTPHITESYDLWLNTASTALADTAGWQHTEALIAEQSQTSGYLGPKTKEYREGSSSLGYDNWFVPAAGQLAYIYTKLSQINTLLAKCNDATPLPTDPSAVLWSSSEFELDFAWRLIVTNGYMANIDKEYGYYVRFLRDITD